MSRVKCKIENGRIKVKKNQNLTIVLKIVFYPGYDKIDITNQREMASNGNVRPNY